MQNPARAARDGIVLVDKPTGWTSHDVVARLRRMYGTRRIGHAGTLDPMATGLLIVGVDRGTRLLTYLVGLPKRYTATVRFGIETVTEDAEGEITRVADAGAVDRIAREEVDLALSRLTGEIEQVPSAVSAIKVDGKRSYARVRAGEQVRLAARQVLITRLERVGSPRRGRAHGVPILDVDILVDCSSGTYVRALARDAGALLGVGAHLVALRRHLVGPFSVEGASELPPRDQEWSESARLEFPVRSLASAAAEVFPVRALSEAEAVDLGHGRRITATGADGVVAAIDEGGRLVALVEDRAAEARPVFVVPAGQDQA